MTDNKSQACLDLNSLISVVGGESELIELIADYRKIVTALINARDARTVIPDVRCWFTRNQLMRLALDLPDGCGKHLI